MDKVKKCERALLDALAESPEYIEFEAAKQEVAGDPELRAKIDAFRQKVYLMQNTNDSIDRLDEMKLLLEDREEVHLDERAGRYLDAEAAYVRLVRNICLDVMSVSDLELEAISGLIDV